MKHSRPHSPPPVIVSLKQSLKSAAQTPGADAVVYTTHALGRHRRRAHTLPFTVCP
jgi:hypothetical protein